MSHCWIRGLFVSTTLLLLSGTGHASDGATEISQAGITAFPYVISQPGRYILTSSLTSTTFATPAIRVDVDDVTIDLNGFTIRFIFVGGIAANGIDAAGRARVSIHDGGVRGFAGHCIEAGDEAAISNVLVTGCDQNGLLLGARSHVNAVRATGNNGVGINAGRDSLITSSIVTGNGSTGIWAGGTISNNTVSGNGDYGVYIFARGPTLVIGNSILGNTQDGLRNFNSVCTESVVGGYAKNVISGNGSSVFGNCWTQLGDNICGTGLCP